MTLLWFRRSSKLGLHTAAYRSPKIAYPTRPPVSITNDLNSIKIPTLRPKILLPYPINFIVKIRKMKASSYFLDIVKQSKACLAWNAVVTKFHPKIINAFVLSFATVVFVICAGEVETVPFTKRDHFIILPAAHRKNLGSSQFETMKITEKFVPGTDPVSVRCRMVLKHITQALQTCLKDEVIRSNDGGPKLVVSSAEGLNWEVVFVKDGCDINRYFCFVTPRPKAAEHAERDVIVSMQEK